MRFLVLMGCAMVGGFLPERHHPKLARWIDWATNDARYKRI